MSIVIEMGGVRMSITIKDVAKVAGVSTATVSKVLNNKTSISEATADRIKKIMNELDYHPNRSAQNFAKKSTKTIVFVSEMNKNFAFTNPHVLEIMVGLENTLTAKGYMLNIVSVTKENYLSILKKLIIGKSIDGLVVHISVICKELEALILDENFPHVIIGAPEYKSQLCFIDNNNVLSGEIATRYLLERGYEKIGYIGGSKSDVGSECRYQGMYNILEKKKRLIDEAYYLFGDSTIAEGARMMNQLLSLEHPPDSVICANNYLALGALNSLHMAGVNIPDEMGVITFDAYPFTKITDPHLTTIDIDVYDLGKQAADIILRKIKKPNLQTQGYTTLAELEESDSTK